MINPIRLKKTDIEKTPYIVWNTFVDIVACGDTSEMSDIQKKAALCFWYDSEVQNGGHLQYFENTTGTDYQQVVDALKWIGASSQAEILLIATSIFHSDKRGLIKNAIEYVKRANEGKYHDLDNEYYRCKTNITDLLGKLLKQYQDEFVLVEDCS